MIKPTITFRELAALWLADKKLYVKRATHAVYALQLEKHLLPAFGKAYAIDENAAQAFVLSKINAGLSLKTVKDLIVVLKMVCSYGAKHHGWSGTAIKVCYPTARTRVPSSSPAAISAASCASSPSISPSATLVYSLA